MGDDNEFSGEGALFGERPLTAPQIFATTDPYEWERIARAEDHSHGIMARRIRSRAAKGGVFLDIGCGTGLVEEILQGLPAKFFVVDGSDGMLRVLERKKLPNISVQLRYVFQDKPIPFVGEGNFDGVVSNGVFYTLPNVEDAIVESRRALKIGGHLDFSFVELRGFEGVDYVIRPEGFASARGLDLGCVSYFHTWEDIEAMLTRHSFEIVGTETSYVHDEPAHYPCYYTFVTARKMA